MCLCSTVHELGDKFDQSRAAGISKELNRHLGDVRKLLAKSKQLNRDVGYQVVPTNHRTSKIFTTHSIDTKTPSEICHQFQANVRGLFTSEDGLVHSELRRRLACIIVYLRSNLDTKAWASPDVASFIQGQKLQELRYAGRKYIKMSRRLGGIGAILWLPLDVPSSTYERYLNMEDHDAFRHLASLGVAAPECNDFVKNWISTQFDDIFPLVSKANLYGDHGDLFPDSDRIVSLLVALGGSNIPLDLLHSVREPQRRWDADGEIVPVSTTDFLLPGDVVDLLRDDGCLTKVMNLPSFQQHTLDDGTLVWSIDPEVTPSLESGLSPSTKETWESMALGLICYACPPCYEGKTSWTRDKKKAIWTLLIHATSTKKIPQALRTQVIEAFLGFSERDFFTIRRTAVDQAKSLLVKSMPFYFHASVALFESIMLRLEGQFDKSNSLIREFLLRNQNVNTRCDNALRGRLHISWIENKVHQYDSDVSSVMYDWKGILPLSTFEIEVTRRLQGTAAKYFHSIGDFRTAQASLEQHLSLASTQPIRQNTRLLITTKLAEIRCELGEYDRAQQLVCRDIESASDVQRKTRPFRRLSMVSVEADIGQRRLDAAGATLQHLALVEPPELDDLNDQVLHMRRLVLVARGAHEAGRFDEALRCWRLALSKMEQLSIFSARHPWTAAVVFLSVAHAQLGLGDVEGARESWARGVEISRSERCEYVIPMLATVWVPNIVGHIHQTQGWPFRMMLPGGRPDVTWS